MAARQDSDNLAWDRSDDRWDEVVKEVGRPSQCRKVEAYAARLFEEPVTLIKPLIIGGYNVLYPIRLEESNKRIFIRLPCPDQGIFPEEKTLSEAATAEFVAQCTDLAVPKVYHHGVDEEIGPFIAYEDLGTRRVMSRALSKPRKDLSETAVLDPEITDENLARVLKRMGQCILHLAKPTFPRIGALCQVSPGVFDSNQRPLTMNMANMSQLSNIPLSVLPPVGSTYETADQWYIALADMQMATLLFQHNNMISSEDDCRNKYVARTIFRRLAKQGKLAEYGFAEDTWSVNATKTLSRLPMPSRSGSFRLCCDDFRPANLVVDDDDNVLGAIDWEYVYAGPTHFVLDPPWWLLIDAPETWDDGIDAWTSFYEKVLPTWLSSIEAVEREEATRGADIQNALVQDVANGMQAVDMEDPKQEVVNQVASADGEQPSLHLAAYMRDSWETGRFWLNYAAKRSWAFDPFYWKFLDHRFFGDIADDVPYDERWRARLHLLTSEEQDAMPEMVRIKVEESKHQVLVDWEPIEARERLSKFLFD